MTSRIDRYRHCAEVCARIDYADKGSIRANNRSVKRMYKIVNDATKSGADAVAELFPLLEDSLAAPWIAHQLLERATVPLRIERRCLKIIRNIAKNSIGDEIWLKHYNERKKKPTK